MRVAVTGATGFIGRHLVERLIADNHEVTALVRPTSRKQLLRDLGVTLVSGNVIQKRSLTPLVRDCELIYHLAARIYWGRDEDYWHTNYQGTKNLLETCRDQELRRFVYTSTTLVTGSVSGGSGDETCQYNPVTPYGHSKCAAEKLVLQYYRQFGVPVTIVRPTVVYGPRNMYHLKLCHWIQRWNWLLGEMKHYVHLSYIDDLLDGLQLVAEHPRSTGEIFIIGDEAPITWRQYYYHLAEALSVVPPQHQIPLWLLRAAARVFEAKSWLLGTEPTLSRTWIEELSMNFKYDISKAKRLLDYRPHFPPQTGIPRTVDWYRYHKFLR